ncbi:MAG: phosphopentomutase [Clostridia bacterium]|nr:phosphopentomutase [Clostridia bacterium]MBQ5487310.1 phosphopentomutase [Clostridia bacterium]
MKKRAIIIVLDSVGIGELPDAAEFGDEGSHTLGNTYAQRPMEIPNMLALGLGNIENSKLPSVEDPRGAYGRSAERTKAKDTTSGHWEMAGLPMDVPFRTYPDGFPRSVMNEFEMKIHRGTLGNCVASGTVIINELGDEHVRTGKPIVYTSADSVFQIAAHEEVIPLDKLYKMCETAREMLVGDNLVGRVIARPFIGSDGHYTRTENRRDFALEPIGETILDRLSGKGMDVVGIGKIEDIFAHKGVTTVDHTKNNPDGIEATIRFLKEGRGDFIFTNLVDTDMLYGHRNDVEGYARALEYFDKKLPEIMDAMSDDDLLIVTADHGCDPTTPSTDHSREYIPILVWGRHVKSCDLGTLSTFADLGATVVDYLTGEDFGVGTSFLGKVIKD